MKRLVPRLYVAIILAGSMGIAGYVIWEAEAGRISIRSIRYVTGGLMVVIGIGFTILDTIYTDERLRRHVGQSTAGQMRKLWHNGWVGALIGAAMIAAEYFLGNGR